MDKENKVIFTHCGFRLGDSSVYSAYEILFKVWT